MGCWRKLSLLNQLKEMKISQALLAFLHLYKDITWGIFIFMKKRISLVASPLIDLSEEQEREKPGEESVMLIRQERFIAKFSSLQVFGWFLDGWSGQYYSNFFIFIFFLEGGVGVFDHFIGNGRAM